MSKRRTCGFVVTRSVQIACWTTLAPSNLHDAVGPVPADARGRKRASDQPAAAWAGLKNCGPPRTKSVLRLLRLQANRRPKSKSTNMSIFIKRIVVLLFVTTLLAIVGVGCNTAHGFGKDMEKAGESIQDGTK